LGEEHRSRLVGLARPNGRRQEAARPLQETIGDDEHVLEVEDKDGNKRKRVIYGEQIAVGGSIEVYRSHEEILYVYEADTYRLHKDVELTDLRDWFYRDRTTYLKVMKALGIDDPVVIVGDGTAY